MVKKFIKGEETKEIIERTTKEVIGEITEDGTKVIRYPHADKVTPQVHWNLENKGTGTNIHVIVE